MRNLSKFCPELFKSKLAIVFLIAQLIFCAFVLDWDKMFFEVEITKESRYKSEAKERAPSFGFSHQYENPSVEEIIKFTFIAFSFPSALVTGYLLNDLNSRHPNWSYERFIIIGNLAFIIFNSVWWLLLGYIIERLHDHYLKIKAEPEKPFTIFSGKP